MFLPATPAELPAVSLALPEEPRGERDERGWEQVRSEGHSGSVDEMTCCTGEGGCRDDAERRCSNARAEMRRRCRRGRQADVAEAKSGG
jgi:hypothetical protein